MSEIERLSAGMLGIGFDGLAVTADARKLIERGVRAIIFFARNVQTPEQFQNLVADVKETSPSPIMTCIDQEGGRVMRLREPFTIVPSMRDVGLAGDEKLAREVGKILARELRAVNIDVDLAPVLDVDSNPANKVISSRSFGTQAELVARMGVAVVEGLQSEGVAACGKHFPGHGDTLKDSHYDLPTLENHDVARLNQVESPPFAAAIEAGIASIMTAHVIYSGVDSYPGTISQTILDGILRKKLGFDGVVMSDDMQMNAIADNYGFEEAIVRGVNAGVDLFWVCHTVELQNKAIDAIVKGVESGRIQRSRLEESKRRIDRMMSKFVKPASRVALPDCIGSDAHRAVADRITMLAGAVTQAGEDPTEKFVRQQKS